MRIAIYHNLPSGGAKRTLFEQARRLCTNHSLDVFTLSCADHAFGDIRPFARHYRIYPFTPSRLFNSPWGRINQLIRRYDLARLERVMQAIARQIDSGGYDVIYVQPCQFTNSPSLLYYLKSLSVFYSHETLRLLYDPAIQSGDKAGKLPNLLNRIDPLPGVYRKALAKTDRRNLSAANQILVNSIYSKERFQQVYGLTPEICYHGVNADLFCPTGGSPGQKDDLSPLEASPAQVVSVGALRSNKGFDFIIRSLGTIPEEQRPSLGIISNAANPALSIELMRLADAQKVDLKIRTLVSDADLVQAYNQASLTVYAPHFEPFGLVPLESMACGTPVVGVAEGGVKETVQDQVTGLVVERDQVLFGQAISGLLLNPSRRGRMGQQAREYVLENWTWEEAVKRLEDFIVKTAFQDHKHA